MTTEFKSIPINIESGAKYTTEQGFRAVKDGIKNSHKEQDITLKKPEWLRIRLSAKPQYEQTRKIVNEHQLSTVCQESKCPNISECWSHGTATIMLLGSVCTRACRFCAVDTGNPKGWLDPNEPANAAKSVQLMGLQYIVLTSVDRDDLADFGAGQYAASIRAIKSTCPGTKVEALTPDFQGREECIDVLLASGVDVFAQNVETVERLTHPVRDPRAGYWQTIDVLRYAKQARSDIITKTSLMLGLGETKEEVVQTMHDLRAANVDVLTLGQYMQPTRNHLSVVRYVTPAEFKQYREIGLKLGFMEVASGPLVRSSYRADRIFTDKNLGLD
ncbi:MAG: lipoyl synthase [Coxiella sp. (in: Bacteria)]|nr:MAG: lipoyl synthase [Coxiella sp. (in: g-proteobacteria)]